MRETLIFPWFPPELKEAISLFETGPISRSGTSPIQNLPLRASTLTYFIPKSYFGKGGLIMCVVSADIFADFWMA